eukprot:snap_masked-scaffold_4-processed-gene-16.16-mRNA-1 protein AED:1.00 eAED:1.00 QI:0/0/0/0/1/1/4/0/1358
MKCSYKLFFILISFQMSISFLIYIFFFEVNSNLPGAKPTPNSFSHVQPKHSSIKEKASTYIQEKLRNCNNSPAYIQLENDVGLGLALTQVVLLTNKALSQNRTPVLVGKDEDYVWFSGPMLKLHNLLSFPCSNKFNGPIFDNQKLSCSKRCSKEILRSFYVPDEFINLGLKSWLKLITLEVIQPSNTLLYDLLGTSSFHNARSLKSKSFQRRHFNVKSLQTFTDIFDFKKYEKPLIGIHIRRGDSCMKDRPPCVYNFEKVLEKLSEEGYNSGTLLLATDNSDIRKQGTKFSDYGFSDVITIPSSTSFYNELEEKKGGVPIEEHPSLRKQIQENNLAVEALLDIALLAQADVHVGSFYSNFIRISMALSKNNPTSKYISFDAEWCPFETCSYGWVNIPTCSRWHKHFCQWRPQDYCGNSEHPENQIEHCGAVAGSRCSFDCMNYQLTMHYYHSSKTLFSSYGEFLWTKELEQDELKMKYIDLNLDCSAESVANSINSFPLRNQKTVCKKVLEHMNVLDKGLNDVVYEEKDRNILERKRKRQMHPYNIVAAPKCDPENVVLNMDHNAARRRALGWLNKVRALESISQEELFDNMPAESCTQLREVPDFDRLRMDVKRTSSAIVYLAQKQHSSYKTNSFQNLVLSLKFLYKNFNNKFNYDVLIFHSGDFIAEDRLYLIKEIGLDEEHAKSLNIVRLSGKFWELPGIFDTSKLDPERWTDDSFSVGYRHMCRWYAGLIFEFMGKLGYEYIMRFDEDSFLLSPVEYDIFDFMKKRQLDYGFRNDIFEPCCDLQVRRNLIADFRKTYEDKFGKLPGFYQKLQQSLGNDSLNYGYYNNFFVSRVQFWLQPNVRALFNFFDWSGAFYLYRENDLTVQALSVQMFLPESKVYKFTDFTYQHITGYDRKTCEWGVLVRGDADLVSSPASEFFLRAQLLETWSARHPERLHKSLDSEGKLTGIYCDASNFKADVKLNYHLSMKVNELPYCFDLNKRNVLEYISRNEFVNMARDVINLEGKGYTVPSAFEDNFISELLDFTLSDCETLEDQKRFLYLDAPECGAGCTINFLVKPIIYAMINKQKIVTPGSRWLHGSKGKCDKKKHLGCFLKEFASKESCGSRPSQAKDGLLWRRVDQDNLDFFKEVNTLLTTLKPKSPVSEPLFLLEYIESILSDIKLKQDDKRKVLGVHIRMGDSCSDPKKEEKGRSCDGFETFEPYIDQMIEEFGYNAVYVATDSEDALSQALSWRKDVAILYNTKLSRSKYKVFTDNEDNPKAELSIEGILFGNPKLKSAGFEPFAEMIDFLADLYILGKYTHGIVGKFTSNMDRIAVGYSAFQHKCLHPVISLDAPWCFDFGIQSGRSYTGQQFYC